MATTTTTTSTTTTTTSKEAFTSLLNDKSAKARVLEFPKGHCWSSAIGFLQSSDERSIFVKDRDDDESILQETISLVGQEFSKPFGEDSAAVVVVTPCYSIPRPELDDLEEGTPAHLLWKLKEEKWKREDARVDAMRAKRENEEKKEESSEDDDEEEEESSVEDEKKPAPSDHDCWQLEQAVTFAASKEEQTQPQDEESPSSVDSSLRRKLRMAAKRSKTGCLDLFTVLLHTQLAQDTVRDDPEWKCYKSSLLDNPDDDALTAEETHLLLHEKLDPTGLEVALLFTAAMALPDTNVENVAIQEVVATTEDDASSWSLRVVHFDTGVLPVSAGVSLEPLELVLESPVGFDFLGEEGECTGYFFPVLLSLPQVNKPLSAAAASALQKVDAQALNDILSRGLSNEDIFVKGLGVGLGAIVQERVESMKAYAAAANPDSSLRDLLFHTIAAWKRDWPLYEEESESAEWIHDILEWANSSGTRVGNNKK